MVYNEKTECSVKSNQVEAKEVSSLNFHQQVDQKVNTQNLILNTNSKYLQLSLISKQFKIINIFYYQ